MHRRALSGEGRYTIINKFNTIYNKNALSVLALIVYQKSVVIQYLSRLPALETDWEKG